MHTETVSVGSELLAGSIIDTNVAHLATQVARIGLNVARHTVVPDDLGAVTAHVAEFAKRAPRPACLLITGGIGPTRDDVTREAVARAFGLALAENADCRRDIEAMFRRMGRPMSESNLRQAAIPEGADPLRNSCGTAPGFHVARGDVHVFVMPGVPAEMEVMFREQVLPRLAKLAAGRRVTAERVLRTFGAGESAIGERIADLMDERRNPRVGTMAASGLISIRIRATAADEEGARGMLDRDEAALRERLGDLVVGCDGAGLPETVGHLLAERKVTLAVAESCTGGLIAKLITDVPGASDYFLEGVVAYANESKTARLSVPAALINRHGAVSEPVARAMAEGARDSAGADYALATTGIAGPSGGSPEKPVGLVFIALAGFDGTRVERSIYPGDRDRVRRRAALAALNLLRLELLRVGRE